MRSICGIYRIFHKETGKSYIGQSINIERRIGRHFKWLSNGNHPNNHLQNAFNFYGKDAFCFQILETCDRFNLFEREVYWIDVFASVYGVYNIAVPEEGKLTSKQIREKLSAKAKALCRSESHKLNQKNAVVSSNKRRAGQVLSEEWKSNISKGLTGRKMSEETKKKISNTKRMRAGALTSLIS
jgi:group I intron endonuclease